MHAPLPDQIDVERAVATGRIYAGSFPLANLPAAPAPPVRRFAARFGLAATLYSGLALQIGALVALAQLDPSWGVAASVAFVMAVQGVSGVAKDLAKMSSKSAVKLLAPKEDGGLFRWVALLTGSKNALKGLGFFLGAALLALAGFQAAIWGMAAVLAVILVAVVLFLPAGSAGPDEIRRGLGWLAVKGPACQPPVAGAHVSVRRAISSG